MKKINFMFFAVFLFLLAEAEAVTVKELLDSPQDYEGKEIEVKGEVLDKLTLTEGSWLNINDEGLPAGVWVDSEVRIPRIRRFGSYKEKGDSIKVWGTFSNNCPRHSGESDIHARRIILIGKGLAREDVFSPQKKELIRYWSIFLGFLCLVYVFKKIPVKLKRR